MSGRVQHSLNITHSDFTRAAVVAVFEERWTSLTAIWSGIIGFLEAFGCFGLGEHSQTLPQLPKPIYSEF
jgi:hypothetical protein